MDSARIRRWASPYPVYTSGRRLRKEGVLRTAWTYAINGIFVIVCGRPFSRTHNDVRG